MDKRKTKTAKQWFSEYTDKEVRLQLLDNKAAHSEDDDYFESFEEALVSSFLWNDTPQGAKYWTKVYNLSLFGRWNQID